MKPTVLIVTDSAYIDTGFARVAREIGTGLYLTGKYEVVQLGWFHHSNDRLVPFRVIPTDRSHPQMVHADKYAEYSYDQTVAQVKPDVVIAIGDQWMVQHIAARPRDYVLMGYVPIDSAPLAPSWGDTFKMFDQLVMYGQFGELVVKAALGQDFPLVSIPHGVDCEIFRPLPPEQRAAARKQVGPGRDFIVGCVARNNGRKQLPRLLKAFKAFTNAWASCRDCGLVTNAKVVKCPGCGSTNCERGDRKEDAILYLHTCHDDPAGHALMELIQMYRLNGFVAMPENMQVGKGVSDEQLNVYYNAFDVFTLPTSAEGWGLPIMEAMAAGLPVLVTEYSGHVQFVQGAGEFISVSDWDTSDANLGERAMVDLIDYVMKLDRFYYERADFVRKWGKHMVDQGFPADDLDKLECGASFRAGLSTLARARALEYQWGPIVEAWAKLIDKLVAPRRPIAGPDVRTALTMEVL